MKHEVVAVVLAFGLGLASLNADAAPVTVVGGQTSVALDFDTLSSVGLDLSSVSPEVIVPGAIPNSVAFSINGPGSASPSTLGYDTTDPLGTISGTIEHTGSVFFNGNAIEVGNFSINTAFEVIDTVTFGAPLFDAMPDLSTIVASDSQLFIEGNLLVSSAFAGVLGNADLAGTPVGAFQVGASVVPLPGGLVLAGTGIALLGLMRHRRQQQVRERAAA